MESSLYPILSLAALFSAPVIYRLSQPSKTAQDLLRGFVVGVVATLIVLHVLPEAIEIAGPWALLPFTLGFVIPPIFERALSADLNSGPLVLGLGIFGLMGHAFLDGVGLGGGGGHSDHLRVAIIFHKLPVGLLLWMLARPRVGRLKAWFLLALVGAATLLGYGVGDLPIAPQTLGLVAAFIGGTLAHIVGSHRQMREPGAKVMWEVLGMAVGCLLAFGIG